MHILSTILPSVKDMFDAGVSFTKDFSSPNLKNVLMLSFGYRLSKHHDILHMLRQQCCRCMCKILWCSDSCIWSYGWTKFGEELRRALVKRLPYSHSHYIQMLMMPMISCQICRLYRHHWAIICTWPLWSTEFRSILPIIISLHCVSYWNFSYGVNDLLTVRKIPLLPDSKTNWIDIELPSTRHICAWSMSNWFQSDAIWVVVREAVPFSSVVRLVSWTLSIFRESSMVICWVFVCFVSDIRILVSFSYDWGDICYSALILVRGSVSHSQRQYYEFTYLLCHGTMYERRRDTLTMISMA